MKAHDKLRWSAPLAEQVSRLEVAHCGCSIKAVFWSIFSGRREGYIKETL
jgi:hypothetical protein